MEYKNRIEITFSKNRHYPEYGENAYNIENHEIVIQLIQHLLKFC